MGILQIRRSHAWANAMANGTTLFSQRVFSLLWGWRTVANVWVACGGVEFEAWFSSVHKKMAYSRVTSLRTIACSYHDRDLVSHPPAPHRPA